MNRSGTLFTLIAVVSVLYFARDLAIPLAAAILLSFLLLPVVNAFEKWGVNRIVSVGTAVFLSFALLTGILTVVATQFLNQLQELPRYKENLSTKIESIYSSIGGSLGKSTDTIRELTEALKQGPLKSDAPAVPKVQVVEPPMSPIKALQAVFGPLLKPVGTIGLIALLVIFILVEREDLRNRLIRLIGGQELHKTTLALDDAAGRVSRYLLMQTIINGVQGTLVAVGLYAIGVPNAALWGALTLVLRFIPYIGPWIAAGMPIAVSIAVFDNWTAPLLTVGLFVALELASNNIMEPWLYGKRTGVTPFALIVAAMFWTWLWGIVGLFLAIPMTVCLVVASKYVRELNFLNVLLGDQPVLEVHERLYQRLLAFDGDEAEGLVDQEIKLRNPEAVFDGMIVPALRIAKTDQERGVLDGGRRRYVLVRMTELVEQIIEHAAQPLAKDSGETSPDLGSKVHVLCVPATDRADAITALMLCRLLELRGIKSDVSSVRPSRLQLAEYHARHAPRIMVICALPPVATAAVRTLARRAMGLSDAPRVLVGLWEQDNTSELRERLSPVQMDQVVTSLAQARETITGSLNEQRPALPADQAHAAA